ncbi:hypothetical protein [Haloarcula sp. Atlit-7R]|uniref:hypothetical protein n=1 Tax=Haloarcula sp. Atlit-7R TaxID=2282125 RepID=UPI00131481D1|nr:hypothetical protein [Haloarcula sp. Atlit-7R]
MAVDTGVDPPLVDTIQRIEVGYVLVVNGDSRTWDIQMSSSEPSTPVSTCIH